MLINKFTKKKNGMYNIILDNGDSFMAHEDIILKYSLLLKKTITEKEKEKIEEENLIYISYDLALKYISVKMRSKKEIEEYLSKKKVDSSIIEKTVNMLIKSNYINDRLYSKAYITDKINLSNDGPHKIVSSLISKGVSSDIALSEIESYTEDIQLEKIKKIVDKLNSTNRNKSAYTLKNKIIEYLSSLGYEKSLVIRELSNFSFKEDKDIAQKEYDKAYKKLSRKYSGKELEYKIKQKMYSMGFKTDNYEQ